MASKIEWYGFISGFWPSLAVFFVFHMQAMRFRSMRLFIVWIALIHAIRSLWLSPVNNTAKWCVVNYLVWPLLMVGMAKHTERTKREIFVGTEILRTMNLDLATKLDAAEKALAFEEPTEEEQRVVKTVFEDGQPLANFSIPFDDLEFHDRVGAGAFAEVISVTFRGSLCVAKRLLRARMSETNVRLMRQEGELLSKLRHPNVVQFLGVSWDSIANLCIVLEYMPRGCLSDVVNPTMTWQDPKLRMASDIVQGVVYLHGLSPPILHRDLKPDNVLVTDTLTCKVSDFGTSQAYQEDSNMTVIGTAKYMAPEVMEGKAYSTAVDVYSFALTLWQMHSGDSPFHNMKWSTNHLVHKVVTTGARPPLDESFPKTIASLILRCWDKDPDRRPSMKEVLDTLRSSVTVEDVGVSHQLPLVRVDSPHLSLVRPPSVRGRSQPTSIGH